MKTATVYLKSRSSLNVEYEDDYIETIVAYLELGQGVIAFNKARVKVASIEAIEWID